MATKKQKQLAAVGAGLAAAAAAGAAGYYFYASKDAKKHRRIVARWALGLKRDVLRQAKKIQNIDRDTMLSIIDTAVDAYENVRGVDPKELAAAAKELRTNWRELKGELQAEPRARGSRARTSTRRATRRKKS